MVAWTRRRMPWAWRRSSLTRNVTSLSARKNAQTPTVRVPTPIVTSPPPTLSHGPRCDGARYPLPSAPRSHRCYASRNVCIACARSPRVPVSVPDRWDILAFACRLFGCARCDRALGVVTEWRRFPWAARDGFIRSGRYGRCTALPISRCARFVRACVSVCM